MFLAKISQTTNAPLLSIAPLPASAPTIRANVTGSVAPSPSSITLKWKMFPADYDVVSAPDMTATNWQLVPKLPAYTNGWYDVSLPTTNGVQFFRLRQH